MPDIASPEINQAHPRTEKEILSVLGSNLKDLGNEQGYEKITPTSYGGRFRKAPWQ